jgi:hypothetical protein
MGMRKRIAKGLLYTAAPKLTFAALHPKQAALKKGASWAMSRMGHQPRHRSSHLGMIGLGAAAIALPLGVLIGRRMNRPDFRPGDAGF